MKEPSESSAHDSPRRPQLPTRAEIESMCVLWALAEGPCSLPELAVRLGLGSELGEVLETELAELSATEHWAIEARVVSATPQGFAWLDARVAALGSDEASPRESD